MRFPQEATSADGLWEILSQGRSVMTEVPRERFNINGFYHPDASHPGTINARGGYFLKDDIAAFDAPFFSMNPAEVQSMDPQQRCLLETAYHAFENAGLPIQSVAGSKTSVYVGSNGAEYNTFFDGDDEIQPQYKATGTAAPILANRLSWFYDLTGPSMTVETACSSSMIALHLACQSIRSRESEIALVCGSQLYLEPLTSAITLSRLQFTSPRSRCRSFDATADGYAKGEGFGALVLRPLADAVARGDTVRAVVRSTHANQDGRTPTLTQPSRQAQEAQIRAAYARGGLDPSRTRLFEAHGTGTLLGDPVEAAAVGAVFAEHRSAREPLYVGAVKTNIGHLEASAGVAAVIKAVLCLERGVIPPNAGFETLNPEIRADEWHLRFPAGRAVPWPTRGLRRASVNSFGFGGSNAHVVLDDAYNYLRERGIEGRHATVQRPPPLNEDEACDDNRNGEIASAVATNGYHNGHADGENDVNQAPDTYVFVLSASDAAGVERLGSAYHEYLSGVTSKSGSPDYLPNLAYTLSEKRSILPWKSYILASSLDELRVRIEHPPKPSRSSVAPRLYFVFTGQGAQWARMGIELLRFAEFRESLSGAESHFKSLGSAWSLSEVLAGQSPCWRLDDPALAQPVCTALQVALVELLAAWDVRPRGVVGHSSGEIAAAFCAGAICRKSAWTVGYHRGALASRLAKAEPEDRGAMMSVQLSEADVEPYINQFGGKLSVGCVNSPLNTTVSGLESSVDALRDMLDSDGVFARKLSIPVAYHSVHMRAIAKEYRYLLQSICGPCLPLLGGEKPLFASSVTGRLTSPDELCDLDYWVQNLVSQVRFYEAVQALCSSSPADISSRGQGDYYIEIGPHAALYRPLKESVGASSAFQYDATLRRGANSLHAITSLAGKLYVAGYRVNLAKTNRQGPGSDAPTMLVDLPKYPFNHSQKYWLESRLFRNYRQRDRIRHELLGLPTTDWNPSKPRWRHTLRVADMPWLGDHEVSGTILYPAAGMLVMVVEAARSIAKPGQGVQGYRLRDVTISNALVLPSKTEGLEVQLYMQDQKNVQSTNIPSIEAREFCLHSFSGGEWRDICSGVVVTEYAEAPRGIYDPVEDATRSRDRARLRFEEIVRNCTHAGNRDDFYAMAQRIGYGFGPTFRTLSDIAYDPAGYYTAGTVSMDPWTTGSPATECVIHPTTLDGVLQTASALNSRGGTVVCPLQAPTQFREVWVSHRLLSRAANARLRVAARADRIAIRDLDTSVVALDAETSEPAVTMEGYRTTSTNGIGYTPSERRDIFYSVEWKPDVELLTRSEKEEYSLRGARACVDWDPSKDVVCLSYMARALEELDAEGYRSPKLHLQKYVTWARRHLGRLGDRSPMNLSPWKEIFSSAESQEEYLRQFAARGPVEKAICDFCSQLAGIIRGDQDPLDLLFNQGLARGLYSDDMFEVSGGHTAAFVDLLAHKNSGMSILEIGAGTGSFTGPVLSVLSRKGGQVQAAPRYDTYTFTDISPSFFEKARVRFADHGDRILLRTLDIEREPAQQGFDAAKYDLVLAAMVLHATANISETLRHARSLLKPGGYLVLVEGTNKHSTVSNGIWGTLPGWWRAVEADRRWGPLYSPAEWERCLEQNGFERTELVLPDRPDAEHHTLSLLVSRAKLEGPSLAPSTATRVVILSADTESQKKVADDIASFLKSKGVNSCEIVDIRAAGSLNGKVDVCVSLPELGESLLSPMSEEALAALKKLTECSSRIYWFTNGAGAEATHPEKAMASGFGHAVSREHPGLLFASIEVEAPTAAADAFRRVYEQSSSVTDADDWESEYLQSGGVLLIPRAFETTDASRFVHARTGQPDLVRRRLAAAGRRDEDNNDDEDDEAPLELRFTTGQLDSLYFAPDQHNTAAQPLADDEVEIEVRATGVNFVDVMTVLGQTSGSAVGHECAGVVRRVGRGVAAAAGPAAGLPPLAPGDRVAHAGAGPGGTFRTLVRGRARDTMRLPAALPFTHACPAVHLTAVYGLRHLARLRAGESVLVHAAAGAVGQAAVQLARHVGADPVFATVSSPDKRDLVRQRYGVPAERIFYSRNLAFGRRVLDATGGVGVDVVLNSLSGESLAESWRVLAPLGRFVEIGKRDIQAFRDLPMGPFARNVSYHSLNLPVVGTHSPRLIGELTREVEELLAAGVLTAPQPVTVFSRGEFEPALRFLQTGQHMGKAVIDWESEAEVSFLPSPRREGFLDSGASYVIAGGLGGIGRSLASWLASRGAKHLILLSRSGPSTEEKTELLKDLASRGVQVSTPCCDVSDITSLRSALHSAAKSMPPVKGCIQGSMVLRDRLLQNMTVDEWQQVLAPKVSGTWNLHDVLPRGMDFFVILSSAGGLIGSSGQSQYNAASTFQDAFARHRWARGERCVSLDVGVVTGVGYAAEHGIRWGGEGIQVLREEELHSVVEWACNPAAGSSPASPWGTQIVTAVGASSSSAAGEDEQVPSSLPHLRRPFFRHLRQMSNRRAGGGGGGVVVARTTSDTVDYGARLRGARSMEEAGGIVARALAERLSQSLSVPLEDIETTRPAHSYGVDSLVAAELRFWFANEIRAEMSVFNILANENIEALGLLAAGKSKHLDGIQLEKQM
ncbi:hypothetical protein GGR56DRAFT_681136 [Xylariaceae sp. FL0804]|nr:hypothetical protein GGR56DRAFT_681136 [Xylariaceae sp. FL0804]